MFLYRLADRLHKTVTELEAVPIDELVGWVAYFKILDSERK